jgi:DNA-binding NarL/FixJ family response regulator
MRRNAHGRVPWLAGGSGRPAPDQPDGRAMSSTDSASSQPASIHWVALADDQELVRAGEAILTPPVTRRLIAEFALRTRSPRQLPHLDELTPREREVLALIATGLSNDEISRKIYISPATVKTHASRAMAELGARDRAQLVVFAYQAGLIRPG